MRSVYQSSALTTCAAALRLDNVDLPETQTLSAWPKIREQCRREVQRRLRNSDNAIARHRKA